jgi:hypothetical protein
MRLSHTARAAIAAAGLIALGAGARLWPERAYTAPASVLRPLPEDLCAAGREGTCLQPGFSAGELVPLYGLPPEAADRLRVTADGGIIFAADPVQPEAR